MWKTCFSKTPLCLGGRSSNSATSSLSKMRQIRFMEGMQTGVVVVRHHCHPWWYRALSYSTQQQREQQQQQQPRNSSKRRNGQSSSAQQEGRPGAVIMGGERTSQMSGLPKQHQQTTSGVSTTTSTDDRRKDVPDDKAILLSLVETISSLQQMLDEMDELPPVWSRRQDRRIIPLDNNDEQNERQRRRSHVFDETNQIVKQITAHVHDGSLRASGKHRHEVTVLFERLMKLYSECGDVSHQESGGVFDRCSFIIDRMREWNLEPSHASVEYAVTVAARESRWKDAAELFWSHIDPDDSGFTPFNISVANPVGLYAIARHAQEQGTAVVDSVFDAVLSMSMVSPSDQEQHILAAGSALGHAGEWQAFVDYLMTSSKASELGQPLAAAVMHACLLCDRHEEALGVFDKLMNGQLAVVGEWQWGAGGHDRINPLCRDLAMRALGDCCAEDASDRALQFFAEVEEDGMSLSLEALCGVIKACEKDGRWEEAVEILFFVLDKLDTSLPWLVSGKDLLLSDVESCTPHSLLDILPEMGQFLGSIMRTCNSAGQFGVALLAYRLFELSLPFSKIVPHGPVNAELPGSMPRTIMIESFLPTLCALNSKDELLGAIMVSLSGVSCHREASYLFQAVDSVGPSMNLSIAEYFSQDLYDFALRKASMQKPAFLPAAWETASRHIHRFTAAFRAVKEENQEVAPHDAQLLSGALAAAIRSCNTASQPEAGIYLAKWVDRTPLRLWEEKPLFYVESGSYDRIAGCFPMTDSLLAATMDALSITGRSEIVLELFDSVVDGTGSSPSEWLLSYTSTLEALFHLERIDDAMSLFHNALKNKGNPGLVNAAATGLANRDEWRQVADLYRLAMASSCLSEDLSTLAMKSVVSSSRSNGKVRILRSIVEEASKLVGTRPVPWVESKYFWLKSMIGFENVRRLMWWDDPGTSHLDELDLAFELFDTRLSSGLTPKKEVLRLIVRAAAATHSSFVPEGRSGLPHIPRDRDGWIRMLNRVLLEAEKIDILEEPEFIDNVVHAFFNLGCPDRCIDFVNDALARGVPVYGNTLRNTMQVADDIQEKVDDVEMMAVEPRL